MRLIDARILLDWRKVWIGIDWQIRPKLGEYDFNNGRYIRGRVLLAYITIIPALPIKVRIEL